MVPRKDAYRAFAETVERRHRIVWRTVSKVVH